MLTSGIPSVPFFPECRLDADDPRSDFQGSYTIVHYELTDKLKFRKIVNR